MSVILLAVIFAAAWWFVVGQLFMVVEQPGAKIGGAEGESETAIGTSVKAFIKNPRYPSEPFPACFRVKGFISLLQQFVQAGGRGTVIYVNVFVRIVFFQRCPFCP